MPKRVYTRLFPAATDQPVNLIELQPASGYTQHLSGSAASAWNTLPASALTGGRCIRAHVVRVAQCGKVKLTHAHTLSDVSGPVHRLKRAEPEGHGIERGGCCRQAGCHKVLLRVVHQTVVVVAAKIQGAVATKGIATRRGPAFEIAKLSRVDVVGVEGDVRVAVIASVRVIQTQRMCKLVLHAGRVATATLVQN